MNALLEKDVSPAVRPRWWLVAAEVALVFAVFFLQGAWPVPDVNEAHYLGKAIHFWNPEWVPNDTFLNSADTHQVFYYTFGWLSLWLSPFWLAWVGRMLTWGLLAWAWRRLSFALVPRPWYSVLTAALFVCLLERFHVAGEWVIGGVEAKGFAYVLVFLGLEALVRNRWNRAWLLLGGASAFHVLVGGWSVVAAGIGWLVSRGHRPTLRSMWPALLGGFLLSLPGLLPSLALTWGVERDIAGRAHEIYVYERLAHHLVPDHFPATFVDRFLLLAVVLLILECVTPANGSRRRLRGFVVGALAIAGVGVAIHLLAVSKCIGTPTAAGLLRFYWFRLSDVAVPMAVALAGARWIMHTRQTHRRLGRWAMAVAILIAAAHGGECAVQRVQTTVPRADRLHDYAKSVHRVKDYLMWRDACRWVAESGKIPPEARFLTPRVSQTFKWYAGRSEVANWKDIPQDAESIVEWWRTLLLIHATRNPQRGYRWRGSLDEAGTVRLRQLGERYDADYVLTIRRSRPVLPVEYRNDWYVIYRLRDRDPP